MEQSANIYRYRVRLAVRGRLAYLSHLDLLSVVERALRRSALPVRYSEGFNPHMIISWGPAHPVGICGENEYFDLDFNANPPAEWGERLNALLPPGLVIIAVREIELTNPALMAAINRVHYTIGLNGITKEKLDAGIAGFMAEDSHIIKRNSPKGSKEVDIRPAILSLAREDGNLLLECRIGNGASPKPQEIAAAVAPGGHVLFIERSGLFIEGDKGKILP